MCLTYPGIAETRKKEKKNKKKECIYYFDGKIDGEGIRRGKVAVLKGNEMKPRTKLSCLSNIA